MRNRLGSQLLLSFFILLLSLLAVALEAQSPSNTAGVPAPPSHAQAGATRSIALNTPQTVSSTAAGQVFEFIFNGKAGEAVSIAATDNTYPKGAMSFSILTPSGATFARWSGVTGSSRALSNQALPTTGTYTLRVNAGPEPGGATFTLTRRITRPITLGGPEAVSSKAAGQVFDLTFSGEAGQRDSVTVTKNNYPSGAMSFSILKPDGSTLASFQNTCGDASLGNEMLPATGTYVVHIDPGAASGGATFTVTGLTP